MEKQKTKCKTRYKVISVYDGSADAAEVFADIIAFRMKYPVSGVQPIRQRTGRHDSFRPNTKAKDDTFVKSAVSVEAGTVMDYNKDAVRHGQTQASGLCG